MPEEKFDAVIYAPLYYGITDYSDDQNPANILLRLDEWVRWHINTINSFEKYLESGGIVIFILPIFVLGDLWEEFFGGITLNFYGSFTVYRNSLINVWIWKKN
jgi:hypothetical protein